jgi:CYTH domain-containing protein
MGIEIERKFLVKDESWKISAGEGLVCRQGYLLSGEGKTVRVRIMGDQAFLTIKGPTEGITRIEYEYGIPVIDAEALLLLCGNVIEKTRYFIEHAGMRWELDVFSGANEGLVMAEIEIDSVDQQIELPGWAGKEVSGDPRYYNACLAVHPFSTWNEQP